MPTRLARAASMPLQRQRNGAAKPPLEWRRFLTVEERTGVRSKLRAAYADQCKTYEELLDTVTAIEVEVAMRDKEHEDFLAAKDEMEKAIAALEQAVEVLGTATETVSYTHLTLPTKA